MITICVTITDKMNFSGHDVGNAYKRSYPEVITTRDTHAKQVILMLEHAEHRVLLEYQRQIEIELAADFRVDGFSVVGEDYAPDEKVFWDLTAQFPAPMPDWKQDREAPAVQLALWAAEYADELLKQRRRRFN